jgi:hypothetical protein
VTTRRTSSSRRRSGSTRRTTSARSRTARNRRPTTPTPRRRRTSRPATTLGAAVGTVVVSFLLGAPWSVRIALLVLVVLGVVGYLVWSRRGE